MQHAILRVNVKKIVAVSDPVAVRDMHEKYVQISGTFVAGLTIQVSLNGGADYVDKGAGLAPGMYVIPEPATHLRIKTTSYVSGDPAAVVAGFIDNA